LKILMSKTYDALLKLRIYDPRAQRRPVLNMEFPEKALTSIAAGPTDGYISLMNFIASQLK